ncbi:hypothetical protein RRG08_049344 [Elysia crispata]|uniref:Uncharacterized protein n=1 Tax=Elysia crispata TaxID=231223 RepID=A0AAE1CEN7_9GAST|nr:hypothetical protein RRG08_049344 [Elysia crispata]
MEACLLSPLWVVLIAILAAVVVSASEVCIYDGRYKICDHGCCGSDCCMSPYHIAGIVFGVIAFICIIAAIVLYCVKKHKRKGRVISSATPRVMMVNGYHQPIAYQTTQPFAPGYASSYGHPGIPPPYGAGPYPGAPPPQYSYGGFPTAPPPSYGNSDAGKNPFSIAAVQAASRTQYDGIGGRGSTAHAPATPQFDGIGGGSNPGAS